MNWEALAETLKLSDEQRSAVEADGKNVLVIAGAGTGKTYTLLARYLKALLCDGLDINQIVAITFTEKAAAEMRQRLRQCLHQLMKFESARERIVQALESLPEAPIGTIHHFCAQLLRRYAYAVGVDPSFSIIDELQAQGLRNRIVTEWLLMQLADALAQCNADVTTLIAEFGFNRVAEILRATLEARLVIEWREGKGLGLVNATELEAKACSNASDEEKASLNGKIDEELKRLNLLHKCIPCLRSYFDEVKNRNNVLDFDDLLLRAWKLLSNDQRVLNECHQQYRLVLLDELQDIDRVQEELLALLCNWHREGRFFGVGDDKQSIYAFRYADVSVINRMREKAERMPHLWVKFELTRSYRATPALTALVNYTFERIMVRDVKDLSKEPYRSLAQPLRAERQAPKSQPTLSADVAFFDCRDEKGKCKLNALQRRIYEADWIARHIQQLLEEKLRVCDINTKEFREIRLGDIAILFRAMTQISIYEAALRRHGIRYHVTAGYGFFATQEVRDLLAALTAIAEPDNELAIAGWLRSPMVGISDDALWRLVQLNALANLSACEISALPDHARERLKNARDMLTELRHLSDRVMLVDIVERLLELTNYEALVAAMPNGRQRLANIRQFVRIANEFGARGLLGLRDFVRYATELSVQEPRIGEPPLARAGEDAVQVMTIHAAKGLEFPVVFVPDLGRELKGLPADLLIDVDVGMALRLRDEYDKPIKIKDLPLFNCVRTALMIKEAAEEERILYVAFTRARDHLVVSGFMGDGWLGGEMEASLKCDGERTVTDISAIWELNEVTSKCVERVRDSQAFVMRLHGGSVTQEDVESIVIGHKRTSSFGDELFLGKCLPTLEPPRIPSVPKPADVPIRISVQALQDFVRCPLRFKLRHILSVGVAELFLHRAEDAQQLRDYVKQRRLESALTSGLLGQWVHRTLEVAFQTNATIDEELVKRVAHGLRLHDVIDVDEHAEAIVELARTAEGSSVWHHARKAREHGNAVVEHGFILKFDTPHQTQNAHGEVASFLVGRIDLAFARDDGCVQVVDFKTDNVDAGEAEAHARENYWVQAQAYAVAIAKLWDASLVRVTFAYLRPNEAVEFSFDRRAIDKARCELKVHLGELRKALQSDDFPCKCSQCITATPHEASSTVERNRAGDDSSSRREM